MKNVIKKISILLILIIIFFSYLSKFLNSENTTSVTNLPSTEEDFVNSNIIKDIKYSSKDLNDNEYIIMAEEGEIDLQNPNIIYLKKVSANIKLLKNNELIKISSNFGKYNTTNYDTIFTKDVEVSYLDNNLTGDYLDFSTINNKLIMSKNVVYSNTENTLEADVVELNTISKNTKIFMHDSNHKVKIYNRN